MRITDIIIKTFSSDFDKLELCVKSISQNLSGYRNLVIICDATDILPEHITSILPIQIHYVDTTTVLSDTYNKTTIGYAMQQILKLSWTHYTDADVAFMIDSDCIFKSPVHMRDFFSDGGEKLIWFYRQWEKAEWAIQWKPITEYILGYPPKYETMVCQGFMFDRKLTFEFAYNIYHRFTKSPIQPFYIDTYAIRNNSLWKCVELNPKLLELSEYNAFGNYIIDHDVDNVYEKVELYSDNPTHKQYAHFTIYQHVT